MSEELSNSGARRAAAVGCGVVVAAALAVFLVFLQLSDKVIASSVPAQIPRYGPGTQQEPARETSATYARGWPRVYRIRTEISFWPAGAKSSSSTKFTYEWRVFSLVINIAACVALVVGAGMGLADIIIRTAWPPRFTLSSIFRMTFIIAVMIAMAVQYHSLVRVTGRRESWAFGATIICALGLSAHGAFVAARLISHARERTRPADGEE